ncbi:MAG: xanthine dehydrogenase accessory protein XdhC [Planctomycetota bacterium]
MRDRRTPVVVTVVHTQGSTPATPARAWWSPPQGLHWGTIGGGRLEQLALEKAAELLAETRDRTASLAVPLAAAAGQCCGGSVTLVLESHHWRRRHVAIFGAGHVGQALGGLAPWLRAEVLLIDPREAAELIPRPAESRPYELRLVDSPEAEVADLPPGSAVLIMTHSHALDMEVLQEALRRDDLAYVGLIGSERKWKRFQQQLLQRGFEPSTLERVTCPIGVGSPSKEPAEIALAVAMELTQVLREPTLA